MNAQPAPERQDAGSDRLLDAEPTRHEVAVARTLPRRRVALVAVKQGRRGD